MMTIRKEEKEGEGREGKGRRKKERKPSYFSSVQVRNNGDLNQLDGNRNGRIDATYALEVNSTDIAEEEQEVKEEPR